MPTPILGNFIILGDVVLWLDTKESSNSNGMPTRYPMVLKCKTSAFSCLKVNNFRTSVRGGSAVY
jgi:hypothetical protein